MVVKKDTTLGNLLSIPLIAFIELSASGFLAA